MTRFLQWLTSAAAWVALAAAVSAQTPAGSDASATTTPATPRLLRKIVISEDPSVAQQPAPAQSDFVVLSPGLSGFDATELRKRLADAQNRPIDANLLTGLAQTIEGAARQQNLPHATTSVPSQNIADGVVRIILLLNPPIIRQILVGEGPEETLALNAKPGDGFVVLAPSLSFAKDKDLGKRLALGEGKPFQERLVAAIVQVVEVFFKQSDYPAAKAILPPQNPTDGILRVSVQLGKVRNIKVEGNRWFSDSLLREKLRIEQGATLRFSELDQAISWTNNNPFRRVRVQINPVENTGEADLVVAVQESMPLRVQATIDNGGNEIVGKNRLSAAATFANLWGRDHQISYQLLTTDKGFRTYQGHGLDYRLPLPWRDQLSLSASYLTLQPSILDGLLTQEGENITTNLRYSHTLRAGDNPIDLYAGFDFKQSNNNLLYWDNETTSIPLVTNKTDTFQFTVGASTIRRDKHGAWAFGANVNVSPGGLGSRNTPEAYNSSRDFADPQYIYGQLTFQRLLTLRPGWDFTSRGMIQLANRNLLPGEQFFIGGASTVRGFRENVFGGDNGFLLSNELHLPGIQKRLPWLPKTRNLLEARFLGFFDVAHVRLHRRTVLDPELTALGSAGLGVRASISTNLQISADYGWQITDLPYRSSERSRGHLKATLAF